MRTILAALAALFLAASPALADEGEYDSLLGRYVHANADGVNRVDYAAWSANAADRAALDNYVNELAAQRPSSFARARAFAYWINLYNAATLKVVLARYPVASIRDIRSEGVLDPRGLIGPWRTRLVEVEGRRLSLDDIEHAILRPTFRDPRVHYAINCASIGCPNLAGKAYRGASLEAQLDAGARAYVNSGRGLSIAGGRLVASRIYQWFAEDFGGSEPAVIAHLRRYAQGDTAKALTDGARIAGYAYDWNLNDASP